MKTHVKNHPFEKEVSEDTAYVVLNEGETDWIKNKESACHQPMKKVMKEKAEQIQKRYKKNVIVYDSDGKVRLTLQID
jgi:hypothetical protein